jgi:ankyrin repeat protein
VTDYTTRQCEAVFYCDKYRRMRIEARDSFSGREIGKARNAVDEVRTLVCFIHSIGGGLEHIRALLWDKVQTQFIQDLHSVLGGDPAEPAIQPDAVLRLAKAFEVSERSDLQLALLDHALPQCPAGPDKSKLADQWIGLAITATDEFEGPPLFLQQAVIAALLTDPHLELDPKSRSALVELADRSVIRKSDTDDLSSLVGSPASCGGMDAPSKQDEERVGINRRTRLMLACKNGDLDAVEQGVERCMEGRAELDARDALGGTALKLACQNGYPGIVKYLLERGANPDARDNQGKTPLIWAVKRKHPEVVRILIAAGATVPRRYSPRDARRDATESRVADDALSSPLFSDESIEVGSEIEGAAKLERLVQACRIDELDTVKQYVADVFINAADAYGRTPLHYACRDGNDPKIVDLLIAHGADLERKDKRGHTPLMSACRKGKAELVTSLLVRGSNANATDERGRTPLMLASRFGHEEVVNLLIAEGAELEIRCSRGRTALTYSAANGHIGVARILLTKGALIESKDDHGRTPLMHAARAGKIGFVRFLLIKGAERNAEDDKGATAEAHARKKNYVVIERKLRKQRGRVPFRNRLFS